MISLIFHRIPSNFFKSYLLLITFAGEASQDILELRLRSDLGDTIRD